MIVQARPVPPSSPPAEEAPPIIQIGKDSQRRKKLAERAALIATLCFAGGIAIIAWFTEGKVFTAPFKLIASFQSVGTRDAAINCQNPKNINTPYCVERRAKVNDDWASMSRYHEGKGNSFTLHSH